MGNDLQRRDFADDEDLAAAFAEWTADRLRAAIAERGAALLVVSGGKTPERFFEALSSQPLDWTRVAITLADERRVPDDSPRSNARLARPMAGPTSFITGTRTIWWSFTMRAPMAGASQSAGTLKMDR